MWAGVEFDLLPFGRFSALVGFWAPWTIAETVDMVRYLQLRIEIAADHAIGGVDYGVGVC
jgi:hypothetical protein